MGHWLGQGQQGDIHPILVQFLLVLWAKNPGPHLHLSEDYWNSNFHVLPEAGKKRSESIPELQSPGPSSTTCLLHDVRAWRHQLAWTLRLNGSDSSPHTQWTQCYHGCCESWMRRFHMKHCDFHKPTFLPIDYTSGLGPTVFSFQSPFSSLSWRLPPSGGLFLLHAVFIPSWVLAGLQDDGLLLWISHRGKHRELHFVCGVHYKSFLPAFLIHHFLISLFCLEQGDDTSKQSLDAFQGLQGGLKSVIEHEKFYKWIQFFTNSSVAGNTLWSSLGSRTRSN